VVQEEPAGGDIALDRLLFASLLVLGAGALLVAARLSGGVPAEIYPPGLLAITAGAVLAAGLVGVALCVPTLLKIVGRRPPTFVTDPPVLLALWLFAMVLLTNNLIGILGFDQLEEIGAFSLGTGGRLPVGLLLASQLPFAIVAVLGVGAGVRRGLRPTLARLGYGPLGLTQIGVVAAFVAGPSRSLSGRTLCSGRFSRGCTGRSGRSRAPSSTPGGWASARPCSSRC
jgi:hypothetical protein